MEDGSSSDDPQGDVGVGGGVQRTAQDGAGSLDQSVEPGPVPVCPLSTPLGFHFHVGLWF